MVEMLAIFVAASGLLYVLEEWFEPKVALTLWVIWMAILTVGAA